MKLYQTTHGYTLRTHDNRVYDIVSGKPHYLLTSETFAISGVLLKHIPNHIKSVCFRLNKKPNVSANI